MRKAPIGGTGQAETQNGKGSFRLHPAHIDRKLVMVSFGGTDQQTTVLALAHGTALADGDIHPF